MIDHALTILVNRLNLYINQRVDELEENVVQLSPPVAPDGVMPVEANDKLLVFITNISKDTLPQQSKRNRSTSSSLQPYEPIFLNLYVAVAANFRSQRYKDSLGFLSLAIQCFAQHNVLDRSVEPSMPVSMERLVLEIENTNMGESSNLWSILGGKYLPSVLYKISMLVVVGEGIGDRFIPTTNPVQGVGA